RDPHHRVGVSDVGHDLEVGFGTQDVAQGLPEEGVVVCDEDANPVLGHLIHPFRRGRAISTRVPAPGALLISTWPPWISARSTMERSPNLCSSRIASSGSRPLPSSSTTATTSVSPTRMNIETESEREYVSEFRRHSRTMV